MQGLLNGVFLLDAILFVAVLYIQVLRTPPPEHVRSRWPLRRFWIGPGLRYLALVFAGLAFTGVMTVVVGNGVTAGTMPAPGAFMAGGIALCALGGLSLLYSIALYWRPSAPKPDGF